MQSDYGAVELSAQTFNVDLWTKSSSFFFIIFFPDMEDYWIVNLN